MVLGVFSTFASAFGVTPRSRIRERADIRSANEKAKSETWPRGVATITEGKIVSLSVETKVAIAIATGFLLMVVGAISQG